MRHVFHVTRFRNTAVFHGCILVVLCRLANRFHVSAELIKRIGNALRRVWLRFGLFFVSCALCSLLVCILVSALVLCSRRAICLARFAFGPILLPGCTAGVFAATFMSCIEVHGIRVFLTQRFMLMLVHWHRRRRTSILGLVARGFDLVYFFFILPSLWLRIRRIRCLFLRAIFMVFLGRLLVTILLFTLMHVMLIRVHSSFLGIVFVEVGCLIFFLVDVTLWQRKIFIVLHVVVFLVFVLLAQIKIT